MYVASNKRHSINWARISVRHTHSGVKHHLNWRLSVKAWLQLGAAKRVIKAFSDGSRWEERQQISVPHDTVHAVAWVAVREQPPFVLAPWPAVRGHLLCPQEKLSWAASFWE